MRRMVAAGLVLLMPLVAVWAPLAHVHPDDHESSHHEGRTLHAHFHGHISTTPASRAQIDLGAEALAEAAHDLPEATTAAPLFVAVTADPLETPVSAAAVFTLLVPVERAIGRAPHVTHGHDPPAVSTLGPRPPPAFSL